ncbi:type I secretion C-terminal target domain-containing protein, partial [uncultured Neptuniibacter sp.]|uniref:type I secretion C-terminal target domain-containing protein n=1 Tax=uncultured Neptuniibacter sp. TaxID=502143 RepID=UPI002639208A
NDAAIQGMDDLETADDVFTYTVSDGTAPVTTTLTVTVFGNNDAPTIQVDALSKEVDEKGLADVGSGELADGNGGNQSDQSEVATGTFTIADTDGLDDIQSITLGSNVLTIGNGVGEFADFNAMIGETANTTYGTVEITGYAAGVFSYSYTLTSPFSHTPGVDDGITTEPSADSFVVKVNDGITEVSATVNIDIVDDIPNVVTPDLGFVTNTTGVSGTTTGKLDIDGNIDNNLGADRAGGTISFAVTNGTDSGFTSAGLTIYLFVSSDGQTLIGSTTNPDGVLDGDDVAVTDNQVFVAALNHDATDVSDDTYTFTLTGQVDGGQTSFSVSDVGFDFVGGNDPYSYFDDTNPLDANGDQDVLLTPMINGVSAGTTNTSDIAIGVSSGNSIGSNEALRVDFVNGISGDPTKNISQADYSNAPNQDHVFDGHNLVNGATAIFTAINSTSDIRIKAFIDDDTDGSTVGVGNAQQDITSVTISYNGDAQTVTSTDASVLVGGVTYTLNWTGDDLVVGGIVADTQVSVFTDNQLTTVEYHHEAGATFKIEGFGASVPEPGDLIKMDFDVQLTDADGDTVLVPGAVSVNISPEDHTILTGDSDQTGDTDAYTILGTEDDNILIGGDGNDVLVGFAGSDELTGNDGLDRFMFVGEDSGSGADTVKDFTTTEGDILDISDLLGGVTEDAATLDQYLHFENTVDGTVVHINADGDYALNTNETGKDEHTVLLEGVDLTAGGTLTDQQILDTLLTNNNLDTDGQ